MSKGASGIFHVLLQPQGRTFSACADEPLLASAAKAGIELASSCRNGTCRACISRLREGEITYRIAWPGVLPEEKAQGWFLPCVAYPRSDLVIEAQ
jgi:ferredoxin